MNNKSKVNYLFVYLGVCGFLLGIVFYIMGFKEIETHYYVYYWYIGLFLWFVGGVLAFVGYYPKLKKFSSPRYTLIGSINSLEETIAKNNARQIEETKKFQKEKILEQEKNKLFEQEKKILKMFAITEKKIEQGDNEDDIAILISDISVKLSWFLSRYDNFLEALNFVLKMKERAIAFNEIDDCIKYDLEEDIDDTLIKICDKLDKKVINIEEIEKYDFINKNYKFVWVDEETGYVVNTKK